MMGLVAMTLALGNLLPIHPSPIDNVVRSVLSEMPGHSTKLTIYTKAQKVLIGLLLAVVLFRAVYP